MSSDNMLTQAAKVEKAAVIKLLSKKRPQQIKLPPKKQKRPPLKEKSAVVEAKAVKESAATEGKAAKELAVAKANESAANKSPESVIEEP
eukprot:CAMPEP_0194320956 /NCGR_PEP_ID=MMETSP0171-20130528/17223_1 /TAXON_ID=218684 /ORGANISM="Corethron pennatum, Strain L29A3" /LENGTH=89 /DNA_ID=CAMNT_0039078673 /DNA_START=91 /DNA_END=359 /DNA_ORIENTATION=+